MRTGQPVVLMIAATAAMFTVSSPSQPTALLGWDTILTAFTAALFVVAVAVAPRWVTIAVATVAAVFVGGSLWLAPVALGLVLAIGSAVLPKRDRWMSAAGAALAVQGLLRIPPIGFFGLPSLIAGGAITLGLWFGYQYAGRGARKRVRLGVGVIGATLVLVLLVGGGVLLNARSNVDRGVLAARRGLAAAQGGDTEAVIEELGVANEALSSAEDAIGSIWAKPLRLVPIVAQHHRAVDIATSEGAGIARQASQAAVDADISSISMSAGSVDLAALAAMEPELARTVEMLEAGLVVMEEARSPWLVSAIDSRIVSLTDEMRDVLPQARVAAEAARVVPGLLGQDAPRRYFVAFGTPAESRELGGFIGSWALLEFDAGKARRVDAGRIGTLYERARASSPPNPDEYPAWFLSLGNPNRWPQNLTSSPDLSVVASAARHFLDGVGGEAIDGFVYVDGYALAAMLQITGPVEVEGLDQPIGFDTASDFLFDEQYRLFPNRTEGFSELDEVLKAVLDGLAGIELPGPERLGALLGPVARQGRLQVETFDDEENAFLHSIQLQREFGWPRDDTSDGVALVQTNATSSKLDLYLHRDMTYDVTVDSTGALRATVTIDLTSSVPTNAPEYTLGAATPGQNNVLLSLYSPHRLTGIWLDGQPAEFVTIDEYGYHRYMLEVVLDANTSRSVQFEVEGQVDPNLPYDLSIWHQPLVNNDTLHIRYHGPDNSDQSLDFELVENTVFSATDSE